MKIASRERIPAGPIANVETARFWEAATQGRLMLPRCEHCGKTHWYPRAICPFCFSDVQTWVEASGYGTIYAFSVMQRAAVPYAIAYVTLAEGPTIMTNIVDCDFDLLRIGQHVKVAFRRSDNARVVPMFIPIAEEDARA